MPTDESFGPIACPGYSGFPVIRIMSIVFIAMTTVFVVMTMASAVEEGAPSKESESFPGGNQPFEDGDENTGISASSHKSEKADDAHSLASVRRMVRRGHVYLAGTQNNDGSFSVDRKSQAYAKSAPIAVTALACLSFMAGGNTPTRGEFRKPLKKGLDYLIGRCDPETGEFHDDGDNASRMHGQGYAMLALAEAYGMYGTRPGSPERTRIAEVLRRSVDLVSSIQTEVGGWWYHAAFSSEHEGSITICIVEALRAARNAGIHVEKTVIDKAVKYVKRSQKRDGSVRYKLNDDTSTFALTAAGVTTLQASGDYDSEFIDKGFEYMLRKDPLLNRVALERYPQYTRFYAAQAYYQYKDLSHWKRWYPLLIDECRELQFTNGSFPNSMYGPVYATALTTLTLQVSFGYLPIFQR